MTLPEMFRNLTGVLRYFATAVVGLCVVALFARDHDVMKSLVGSVWTGTAAAPRPPAWAIIGALATLGLTTYAAHRVTMHYVFSGLVRGFWRIFRQQWPSDAVLRRARWVRRGTKEGDEARSVQTALDEMNATAHFFYCSAWIAIVAWLVISRTVTDLNVSPGFGYTCALLVILGFVADCQAASADAEEHGARGSSQGH